jgi:hypothetical protein
VQLSNVEAPAQIICGSPETLNGGGITLPILTVVLTQAVFPQLPSYLTKYDVVTEGITTRVSPVPARTPVQDPLYHFAVKP